jgi:hypothetical protein
MSHALRATFSVTGDRNGGNAAEAATTLASGMCGVGTLPTCQSRMYSRLSRRRLPLWRLVATKTK